MTSRETNEIAIARRLLGAAAQIGHAAVIEEIAAEANAAKREIAQCPNDPMREKIEELADWLSAFATSAVPEARLLAIRGAEMAARDLRAKVDYCDIIAAGAASLAPNEYWCVYHPDGPLEPSASKDFGDCVRRVCDALNSDWDVLTEQGFRLGKIVLEGGGQ